MKRLKLFLIIAVISGGICIGSAVLAANLPGSESDGSSTMSDIGTVAWITVLVTLPAFIVFLISLIGGMIALFVSRKK